MCSVHSVHSRKRIVLVSLWLVVETRKPASLRNDGCMSYLDTAQQGQRILGQMMTCRRASIPDDVYSGTLLDDTTDRLLDAAGISFVSRPQRVTDIQRQDLTWEMLDSHSQNSRPMLIRGAASSPTSLWNPCAWSDTAFGAEFGEVVLNQTYASIDGVPVGERQVAVEDLLEEKAPKLSDFFKCRSNRSKATKRGRHVQHYCRRLPLQDFFPDKLAHVTVPAFLSSDSNKIELWREGPMLYWGRGFNMWQLHYDNFDNYYTILEGSKLMRLYAKSAVNDGAVPWALDGKSSPRQAVLGKATYSTNAADPIFSKVDGNITAQEVDVVVAAGDAIFLPKGWGHFTLSAGPESHKALAIWFTVPGGNIAAKEEVVLETSGKARTTKKMRMKGIKHEL